MFAPQRNLDPASFAKKLNPSSAPIRPSMPVTTSPLHSATTTYLPSPKPSAIDVDTHPGEDSIRRSTGDNLDGRNKRRAEGTRGKRRHLSREHTTSTERGRHLHTTSKKRKRGDHTAEQLDCHGCSGSLVNIWYQCSRCHDVAFCLRCKPDAAILHPGHQLVKRPKQTVAEDTGSARHDGTGGMRVSHKERPRANAHGAPKGPVSPSRPSSSPATHIVSPQRQVRCNFCSGPAVSLKCQVCSEAYFCTSCAKLHSFHTMAPAGPALADLGSFMNGDTGNHDGATIRSNYDSDTSAGGGGGGGDDDDDDVDEFGYGRGNVLSEEPSELRDSASPPRLGADAAEETGGSTSESDGSQGQGPSEVTRLPRPRGRPPKRRRRRSVHVSFEAFSELRDAMRSVTHAVHNLTKATERMLSEQSPHMHAQVQKEPKSLLNFPVDLTTLSDDNFGDEPSQERGGTPTKKKRLRPWTPEDRRKLRKLVDRGLSFEQIGAKLGRTAGAVQQRWRKQS